MDNSDWGWESEFIKLEFIDAQFRNDFDAELQKIKENEEYQENLEDAVNAVWTLIEKFIEDSDTEVTRFNSEDLQDSIWEYIQS